MTMAATRSTSKIRSTSACPLVSLHTYWDDLPGPPWLRGQRLEKRVRRLIAEYPAPVHGDVALWRDESHRLLPATYPDADDSLLPIVSETFNRQAHAIADRRIVRRRLPPGLVARNEHQRARFT